jgi:hypothetical protein
MKCIVSCAEEVIAPILDSDGAEEPLCAFVEGVVGGVDEEFGIGG